MYNATDSVKDLFRRIAEGDEAAFKLLFDHYLPILRPFIFKLVQQESGAEDVMQNTFVRVWLNRDKLEGVEHPQAWLYRLTANECYTWLKKEATLRLRHQAAAHPDTGYDPVAGQLALKETRHLIAQAVDKLPPQRKQIYLLSRNAGLKIPEIADQLQLSQSYIKNAIVFSLKSIRDHLEKNGHYIPLIVLLFIKE
ncbi:sigma-70 family RNA polymerase sigma factor [Chitinophaga agrisoli]|uniref:Sigma-70 family RNA polymerase sigma factor n=1 Tax=Chitinophaga agrisoli TaxID=2607653 RepID=A0A5B2VHX4_9BACT|nr:sigma-70 family RNA polymerase sigma factor [Chitinophaga agrisoli]KAA2238534.1 sigma-70 family RNA polymerase sigma factor [Chitinophaga agrisoli]